MDFQDFIIEFAQDYGIILLPLCFISIVYVVRQVTAKKSSEQFGLGQGATATVTEEKTKIVKRKAANRAMDTASAEKSQPDHHSTDQSDTNAIKAQSHSFDEDYDDEDYDDTEADLSDHTYDDEYYAEDTEPEEDELDEEEAYGDILDDEAFNQQGAEADGSAQHDSKIQASTASTSKKNAAAVEAIGTYVVMYLVPNQDKDFLGYELLQALANYHVHLSEKKHFQRFANDDGSGELWFHVASMTNPGTFDMSEPGKLTCQGLVFILEVDRVDALGKAYDSMLETCHFLADDLDGQLLDDKQQPFQDNLARRNKYFIAKGQLAEPVSAE